MGHDWNFVWPVRADNHVAAVPDSHSLLKQHNEKWRMPHMVFHTKVTSVEPIVRVVKPTDVNVLGWEAPLEAPTQPSPILRKINFLI